MTEPNTWSWDWGFLSNPWRVIDFIDQLQISTGRWAMLLAMESQRTGRNPTAAIARASLSLPLSQKMCRVWIGVTENVSEVVTLQP